MDKFVVFTPFAHIPVGFANEVSARTVAMLWGVEVFDERGQALWAPAKAATKEAA